MDIGHGHKHRDYAIRSFLLPPYLVHVSKVALVLKIPFSLFVVVGNAGALEVAKSSSVLHI
jgi:hypothetical protein